MAKHPKPVPATFDDLIRGKLDSMLVKVHGMVQAADLDAPSADAPGTTLKVFWTVVKWMPRWTATTPRALQLLDSEVEITGVAGGKFDGKGQLTGIVLHVASLADIRILKPAAVSPWSLPVTPMDQVLSVYHVKSLTRGSGSAEPLRTFSPVRRWCCRAGTKASGSRRRAMGPCASATWQRQPVSQP